MSKNHPELCKKYIRNILFTRTWPTCNGRSNSHGQTLEQKQQSKGTGQLVKTEQLHRDHRSQCGKGSCNCKQFASWNEHSIRKLTNREPKYGSVNNEKWVRVEEERRDNSGQATASQGNVVHQECVDSIVRRPSAAHSPDGVGDADHGQYECTLVRGNACSQLWLSIPITSFF